MGSILFLGVLLGLMYAVMIRPQQKRMREHQSLIRSLEEGDLVVTASGVHGAVAEVEDTVIWLEVAPEVELKIDRTSIARRLEDDEEVVDDAELVEAEAEAEAEADADDA
ncbi:MAG: preprotein translocase subunit YajC [Acidimicrobiales bacterium]|nr:preprotein translocase subunit YajC [Acidimicrobiales bacterium]